MVVWRVSLVPGALRSRMDTFCGVTGTSTTAAHVKGGLAPVAVIVTMTPAVSAYRLWSNF